MLDGNQVKILRERKGIGQRDLAKMAKVGLTVLNQFENGKASPTYKTLLKLEAALGCSDTDAPKTVEEATLLLAHELEALALLLRDPAITTETKRQKLDTFSISYVQGRGLTITENPSKD